MSIHIIIDKYLHSINNKLLNRKIPGKDLMNITESKQINLFIIKNIYDKWNDNFNINKLEYFNYEDPNVIKSVNDLKKNLSYNILLGSLVVKNLIYKSIEDVIHLIANQKKFIKSDILKEKEYNVEKLMNRSRYYCNHKEVFEYLANNIQEAESMTKNP